ncbi:hypothetical protein JCM39194_06300 [Desulfotomaculum varum]
MKPKEKKQFATGEKFVREPTGSATKVKVDGQGDYNFYQPAKSKGDNLASGDNPLAE